ncbi:ParA family protein [Novosphingobium cyanobacteriorum]|uniref:ParA family protein n=1 Tax=Novosphingobium cyanobacteriorum TaxID=3024215 RepID=A0ABT6CIM4_9SPHN|nr:ParA family protein [Novosphingobium cyanobacteriorum]MDF8333672.1 ParA family protein [Novosphingobium cyanobacteriorum]
MAVIGVFSAKGGVGKTTLAVELAWRSAVGSGHRTLLWDLDAQGGCSYLLRLEEPTGSRAASAFYKTSNLRDLIVDTRFAGLSLLPSDQSLRNLVLTFSRIGSPYRLAQQTKFLAANYDRVIMDCPPGLNATSEQIIAAADLLLVPLSPTCLKAGTLDKIRSELIRHHRRHPPILPVLSMLDIRRRLHRETLAALEPRWPVVPMNSLVEQMAVRRAPLGSFASWSEPSRAMERLFNAIEVKIAELESRQ